MRTTKPIHPEWLSQTVIRFYHWMLLGYRIDIEADGSYYGERDVVFLYFLSEGG